jgi:NifB/MoaA-like Fe-S oxidoreductase
MLYLVQLLLELRQQVLMSTELLLLIRAFLVASNLEMEQFKQLLLLAAAVVEVHLPVVLIPKSNLTMLDHLVEMLTLLGTTILMH